MRSRPTMSDIAGIVGVHVSTVSRALDPKTCHLISPEIVAKVGEVAAKLGFRPNAAGASLRTNRSRTIGIVVPDITDPVFPPMIRGVEDVLSERGYAVVLANTDGDEAREAEVVASMLARSVDGLALASSRYEDKLIPRIGDVPVVTVFRETTKPVAPCVVFDENCGIRHALTHLVSLGHRRIANIAGPRTISTGYSRWEAFERHRREMKLPLDKRLVVFADGFNEQEGERCAETLLARTSDFTAILCANDRLAVGVIDVLKRYGLRCPDDVSVTGFNDMPYAGRFVPALTTVRVQQYKAGWEAARLLLDAIETGPGRRGKPARIVLPVELVVRGSTQQVASKAPPRTRRRLAAAR
ncbi:LacI family transcriptional regulator [Rhodoplanes tepidamans]|uniref:LacI family DNA-binding transcriptional regulator n=2 Tax=Rhodoplanes TaxID=29407 RepID=A0ABT5J6F6_RHOTP|nr:LacI family DNA-binding transcriptional regulator [Rhodoplanes tepidamans]MDC7785017.1 LacI family DNA-binding transcriptional regulator [Rhodoplanes tepidamans]MDQ0356505.1 LacI family transcriptional regulator [Rhodoplanes tepidamans]